MKSTYIGILLVFFSALNLRADEAIELVKKVDLVRAPQSQFSCDVKVDDDSGEDQKSSTFHVSVKDERTSLVDQLEPQRARGRRLLLKDYDMWLYTPNMKRATRISLEQKLTGEVSNGDLARTNFAQDYIAKEVGRENLKDKVIVKLELTAKSKEVTYRRLDLWVENESGVPIKAQFFALSGKLLKEAVYEDFRAEMGTKMIHKMTITDALKKNRTSVLRYSNYKKEKFSAAKFNKETLDQD